jgi:cytidylate kinase
MIHPFTAEDVENAASEISVEEHVMQRAIKCLWDSAVERGAVQECRDCGAYYLAHELKVGVP